MHDETADKDQQAHHFERYTRQATKKERELGKAAWRGYLRLPYQFDHIPWSTVREGDTRADVERLLDEDEQRIEQEQPFELERYYFVPGRDKPGSFIVEEEEKYRIWVGSVLVGDREWCFWDQTKLKLLRKMVAWARSRLLPITADQLEALAQAEQDRLVALFYALKTALADAQGA